MIKNIKTSLITLLVLTLASFSAASQTATKSYPEKPVRVLLGFPSGAVTDALTRTVAQQLSERLNQQFVVDNRPGAATRIAMEALQKSPPDGQTIAVGNAVVTTFGLMFDGLSFDPGKEFVPISMLGRSPSFLAVRGNMPVKNFEEFKKFAKGAKLSVGHPGNGTNPHIAGAALARSLGADVVEVAFKGGAPLAAALGSGDIDFALVDYQSTRALVDRGAIRLLAVTEPRRFSQAPNLPTGKEVGILPEIEGLTPWFILMAPPGTSKDVVDVLNREVREVMKSQQVIDKLATMGLEPESSSPAEAGAYFMAHRAKVQKLLKELNISLKN
jgi:tripartite-type tricarboxylate transporter receptor subunit TctC